MNITIPELDTEQAAALTQLTSEYNSMASSSLTEAEYGATVLMGVINHRKMENIDSRGRQLIEAAKTLPDAKRIEFTDETVSLLQRIASE
jgi:hypothetical protein